LIFDKVSSELTGDNNIRALTINSQGSRPDGKNVGDLKCHGNWVADKLCSAKVNTACKFGYEFTGDRWAEVTRKRTDVDLMFDISYGIKQCH
jgi:hypothetical protein